MKKVFMIAYQYPPMGGPGVQRTLKFTKYLKKFYWEPAVFTKNNSGFISDRSLVDDIPQDVQVIRTKSYDFENQKGLLKYPGKFISRKVLIPDGAALWYVINRRAAFNYVNENHIDVIYSTSYPYSDHLMALHIKKKFPNIPWVADFRDEWINNPYLLDNPYYSMRMNMEKRMESKVISNADKIIANTPVMMKNFINAYKRHKDKFVCIPNGFDKDDFVDYKKSLTQQTNNRLTFTYTGMLYGRRKPDLFLECIRDLIDKNIIEEDKICVRFIGKFQAGYFKRLADKYKLHNVINVYDYMPHKKCIRKLQESDVLLLIEGAGPGGEAFYTGKLFEYLNAGKTIAAVIPDKGVAADLIRKSKTGYVAACDDKQDVLNLLKKIYSLWENDNLSYNPDYNVINKFERKNLTSRLADLFNTITGG